jgi:hypothetical protein
MTHLCQDIDLFADGALDEARAEAFRQHLPGCHRCQAELADRVQMRLLADEYGRHVAPKRARPLALPRVSQRVLMAAAVTATCIIVAVLARGMFRQPPADIWLTALPQRPLDARLSYVGLDAYRARPSAKMMGPAVETRVLPLQELAEIEKRGDLYGLLAAYLVRQDWKNAQEVLDKIEARTAEEKDALANDEAVLRLGEGQAEEALRLLDEILERRPNHPQARWNRALTLEALRLDMSAAEDFEEIATRGEPGWAREAGERARTLREPLEMRRTRWLRTQEAALSWVRGAALPQEVLANPLPILRLHFYDAVRTAPSPDSVLALLPVAQALDPRGGLEHYLRDVASHDFVSRAQLAAAYARLLEGKLSGTEQQALLDALRHTQEHDLWIGTLVQTERLSDHLDELEQRAAALRDPWFEAFALQERAKELARKGKIKDMRQHVEEAHRLCQRAEVVYRCLALNLDLAYLFTNHGELDLARATVDEGLRQVSDTGEWEKQWQFVLILFDIARFQNQPSLARAFAQEALALARGDTKQALVAQRIRQGMAHMLLRELRFADARAELDELARSSVPLTLVGALVLADVARKLPRPEDEATLRRALDPLLNRSPGGQHALATHTWGRFFIQRDPARGRRLLRNAIQEADAASKHDADARRARMHSFTLLILDAGGHSDYKESLRLFSEEQGWALPSRCLVAATVETERSLVLVQGPSGELRGFFEGARPERLREDLSGLVPREAIDMLRPCDRVDVFARPPLLGRRQLLPPELPWVYRVQEAPPRPPPTAPGKRLIVADVELPTHDAFTLRRRLMPLVNWTAEEPGAGPWVRLLGRDATPKRVLREMAQATDVDIITHGLVSENGRPFLVLAEDGDGNFKLTADQIGELTLEGAPFVLLAACEAGDAGPGVHETHSLPEAFVRAGARGVIAATTAIPYGDAKMFFPALRARIRNGEPPVTALWHERTAWLQRGQGTSWLADIYVVE